MGGKAFTTATGSEPALVVPRMEPAVYFKLKAKYIELLRSLFRLVACPLEAPGKRDYGDIDIVVSDPDDTVFESIYQNLSSEKGTLSADPPAHDIRSTVLLHVLDARRHLSAAGAISYAVPHPEEKDAFVQLDINQISSDLHVWQVFHHSHGDLWNLLGTSVRAFGMTVTEDGLYVRDPDIEKLDKKRSRVFLTRDPAEILNFMSLDYDEWNKGWATEDEMFRYATKSRFFVPGLYMSKGDLKANDRKRLGQRPCFRRFVEEYVPYLVASQQEHVVGEGQPSSGQAVADSNDEKYVVLPPGGTWDDC